MKKTSKSNTATSEAKKSGKVSAAGNPAIRRKSAKSPVNVVQNAPTPAVKTNKTEQCLTLINSADGATIEELQAATGWQAHSVRGFLAGTVKKKLGLNLDSKKGENGVRRYFIVKTEA